MAGAERITHYEHFTQFIESREPYQKCTLFQQIIVYQQHYGAMIPAFLEELILELHPDAEPKPDEDPRTD